MPEAAYGQVYEPMTRGELEALIEEVTALPAAASPAHGNRHWVRVAWTGLELADRCDDPPDRLTVILFALIHDSKRKSEWADPGHGPRAASFVRRLAKAGRLRLDEPHLTHLNNACYHHDQGQRYPSIPSIGTCWDADRLQLWRVGQTPNPRFFSTEAAAGLVEWALRLQRESMTWGRVLDRLSAIV